MASLPSYSNKVVSTSLTPNVFGRTLVAFVWSESSDFPVTASAGATPVFNFDFGVSVDSERALALAPRIPFTNVTADLAGTGETDRYWTLTFTTTLTTPASSAAVYLVSDPDPDLPSSSNLIDLSLTPSAYIIKDLSISDSEWVLNGTTYDLVFELDFNSSFTTIDGTTVTNAIHKIVNDPVWNGRIQVFFDLTALENVSITALTFAGLTQPFHSGQMGLDIARRARVVHDYISGTPYLSDEAVTNPWTGGAAGNIPVHPSSADPEEQRRHHPYTPPPGEGVVDDDIPDVE